MFSLVRTYYRYLHPREKNDIRITDLKQYENDLNTQGIVFPIKVKDITKFETLNPTIPGINVFSVNEFHKFYPLRMAKRDPQNTIDLFLYEEDGKTHYSLIKNFRSQITSRTNGQIYMVRNIYSFLKREIISKTCRVLFI